MSRIISSGRTRNLVSHAPVKDVVGPPDPTERKFATFVTDTGAVHTIIVDVDHVANDVRTLLNWFDETRTLVEQSPADEQPGHKPHRDIVKQALARIGLPSDDESVERSLGTRSPALAPEEEHSVSSFGGGN